MVLAETRLVELRLPFEGIRMTVSRQDPNKACDEIPYSSSSSSNRSMKVGQCNLSGLVS